MKNVDVRQLALPCANPVEGAKQFALNFHDALGDTGPGDLYREILTSAPRYAWTPTPTAPSLVNRCPLGHSFN